MLAGSHWEQHAGRRLSIVVMVVVGCSLLWFGPVRAHFQSDHDGGALPDLIQELDLEWLALELSLEKISGDTQVDARRMAAHRALRDFEHALSRGRWTHAQISQLTPRLTPLASEFPDLVTPAIRLGLLHGDFIFWERQWFDCAKRPIDGPRRYAIKTEFERIHGALNDLGLMLAEAIRLRALRGPDSYDTEAGQWHAMNARQAFISGWSAYYAGILDDSQPEQWWRQAESEFRRFLDLAGDARLAALPVDWIDVESPWQARTLVGLAATLSSLGRAQDADWCWRVIANQANVFVTEPERTRWQFRALAWSKRTKESLRLAQDQLQVENGLANREFWTLCLEHAAYLRPTGDQHATELLAMGAIGFIRTGSIQPLADVLLRLEIEWNDHRWVDHWLQGIQAWRQADVVETSDEHAAAALKSQHHLNEVIRQSPADYGPLPMASAAYVLAHFSYDASDWKEAVKWAEQALALSQDADAGVLRLAAAWLNAQSQVQLARHDRSRLPTAWAALDALQAEFPQSIEAQRAALIRIKLENTWLTPGEALNNLSGLPDSPWLKGDIAFERLLQLHRGWTSELKRNPDASEPLRRLLLDEWRGWQALPLNSNESKGAARLLVVDALLRGTDSTAEDVQQAERLLAEQASWERTLSPRSPLLEEGRFQRMLLAQRKQDEIQLIAQAEWLAKNARAVASRRAALIVLSQHWEAVWESGQRQDLEVAQSLHRCLTELVEVGQQSGGTAWLNDGAMRYAVRRLAECDTHLGRMQQADQWYDQLLSSGKPDREVLMASGRIKMRLAQWSAAAARWRELGDGVAPGSESWLESRWHLAQCLTHLEPATAMAICDQTLLLYPDMPEVWRQRLQSVGGR